MRCIVKIKILPVLQVLVVTTILAYFVHGGFVHMTERLVTAATQTTEELPHQGRIVCEELGEPTSGTAYTMRGLGTCYGKTDGRPHSFPVVTDGTGNEIYLRPEFASRFK